MIDKEKIIINVWYPFWVYSIKIRYKLLSELGEISHLILKAMNDYSLSLEDLSDVMGLSKEQLQPVVGRLIGLGLLKDQKITEQGKTIAYIANHIHDKELKVAIDRHYYYQYQDLDILIIPEDSSCLETIPPEAIQISYPRNIKRRKEEDTSYQTDRVRHSLEDLAPLLIPQFDKILPSLGKRNAAEWDVKIDYYSDDKGVLVELPIKPYSKPAGLNQAHLTLTSPALVLKTQFQCTTGISWKGDEEISTPEPRFFVYSAFNGLLNDNYTLPAEEEEYLLCFGDEPLVHNTTIAKTLLEHSFDGVADEERYFSIQHEFSEERLMHEYSYKELMAHLEHPDIVRVKQ